MIEAIIVDDEKNAITALRNDLNSWCPEVKIVAEFSKASAALAYANEHLPQLIFLDIDMPVINGFDFVKQLQQPAASRIIFITAYSEFAVRAFKVNALDYLLKPINPAELIKALQKLTVNNSPNTKIALPVNDGYHLIDPIHIIYCRAAGAYTKIVIDNDKSFLLSRTLGRTQEIMPADLFERVHQSYLINLRHVKKFRKGESPVAVMTNDEVVKVSRLNKDRLAALLGIK